MADTTTTAQRDARDESGTHVGPRSLTEETGTHAGTGTHGGHSGRLSPVLNTDRIGPYKLISELRRGGMGIVYLGQRLDEEEQVEEGGLQLDEGEERWVVLKMAIYADDLTQARFRQEIRATRGLDHRGIVQVRDEGVHEGRTWYTMDFIGSTNLADILAVRGLGAPDDLGSLIQDVKRQELPILPLDQRLGLPVSTTIRLLQQIAEAVSHAHARGVLHRDLKPANIILSDRGEPVLADFGVARHIDSVMRLTAVDEVVGTYVYIAPEQLAGDDIDERADVYGLGAILYECLSGQPPPRRYHGCDPLPLPPRLPRPLKAIIHAALEPDPKRRMPSAAALVTDLRRYLRGEAVAAQSPSSLRRLTHAANKHVVLTSMLLALLMVTALLFATRDRFSGQQRVIWDEVVDLDIDHIPANARIQSFGTDDTAIATVAGQAGPLECYTLTGAWVSPPSGAGLMPDTNYDLIGHYATGIRIPAATGQRVSVEASAPDRGMGEISVFLGAHNEITDGYTFQLGAYENSCSLLKRGGITMWMGPGRLHPGRRYRISLERLSDRIRALVDGVEVATLNESLPLEGPLAGFFTYKGTSTSNPTFYSVEVESANAPQLEPPDWTVVRLAQAGLRVDEDAALHLFEGALQVSDDLLHRLPDQDPRYDQVLIRRGALLGLAGRSDEERQRRLLLERTTQLRHSINWHVQLLYSIDPEDRDAMLAHVTEAMRLLTDQSDQIRYACLVEREFPEFITEAVAEQLLRHIPEGDPIWQFLMLRMSDTIAFTNPSTALQERYLIRVRDTTTDTWWRRRAVQEMQRRQYIQQPFLTLDRARYDELTTIARQNEAISNNHLLASWYLGGPEPEGWRSNTILDDQLTLRRLQALLDGEHEWPQEIPRQNDRHPRTQAKLDWQRGIVHPLYGEDLTALEQPFPRQPDELNGRFANVASLLQITPTRPDYDFSFRVLACLLLAYPDRPWLRDWARVGSSGSFASNLLTGIAVQYLDKGDGRHLIAAAKGPTRQVLAEVFARSNEQPVTAPDPDAVITPFLRLLLARAHKDQGRLQAAIEQLRLLSLGPDYLPETHIAMRLLQDWTP